MFFNIEYVSENKKINQVILFINKDIFYFRRKNSIDIFKDTLFKEFSTGSYLVALEDKAIMQRVAHDYLKGRLETSLIDKNVDFEIQKAMAGDEIEIKLGLIYNIDLATI